MFFAAADFDTVIFYEIDSKIVEKYGLELMIDFISFLVNDRDHILFAVEKLSDITLSKNLFIENKSVKSLVANCLGPKVFEITNPFPRTYPPLFCTKEDLNRGLKKSSIEKLCPEFYIYKNIFVEYLDESIIEELKKLAYPSKDMSDFAKNYSAGYQILLKEFNLC